MRFKDKVCVVTGGTNGIGIHTARQLVNEGATVIVLGRGAERGEKCAAELGENCRFIQCDVSQADQVERAFADIESTYPRLDYAFNNAGITAPVAPIVNINLDGWRKVMQINLDGMLYCLKSELRLISQNENGAIVNMSSCTGLIPVPWQAAYITSKAAINALTEVAAIEHAVSSEHGHSVRVNSVAPGPISGGMNSEERLKANPERTKRKIAAIAMKRMGEPEEVAETVLWLLSDASSFITGAVVPVDGGFSISKF